MKFFHLSDLHIGLKLLNHDLNEDQEYILNEICSKAKEEQPDAVLIAGDLYDKAIPSAEAIRLFDSFLGKLTQAVPNAEIMMISGNHDSAQRINIFRDFLAQQKIHMIGLPPREETETIEKVTLTDAEGNINFYLLPFVKPSMVKNIVGTDKNGNNLSYNDALHKLIEREAINTEERNVLVSHQFYLPVGKDADSVERMDSEIPTVGNIDAVKADILERFDYAALGHIHKPTQVGKECYRYCGTPLACSVSEAGQEKGIIMVEMGKKGDVKTKILPLEPLRNVRIVKGELAEIVKFPSDDYITVVLTDTTDLDPMEMQGRLRSAFPNLLEIKREVIRSVDYTAPVSEKVLNDPFELCLAFLGNDLSEEVSELLQDVINSVINTVSEVEV